MIIRHGSRVCRPLLVKSIMVTLVTVGLFFAGQPIALVALGRGRGLDAGPRSPRAGLSVDRLAASGHVRRAIRGRSRVRGQCRQDLGPRAVACLARLAGRDGERAFGRCSPTWCRMCRRSCSSSRSWRSCPEKELAWLALSMSSTLAGNLTILGSVANLIVVENARRAGTELGFVEYLKVGVPLTVLTTLVGVAWLSLVHY